jgi:hypothetical protein
MARRKEPGRGERPGQTEPVQGGETRKGPVAEIGPSTRAAQASPSYTPLHGGLADHVAEIAARILRITRREPLDLSQADPGGPVHAR